MKTIFYVFMIVTLLLDILGDFYAKKWSIDNKFFSIILLVLFYSTSGLMWGISLKNGDLARATLIINILNVLAMVAIGIFLYGENLNTQNKFGLVLGILSLYLINKD